jgi:O-antigen/teichoic acid export membrane protein
MFYDPITKALLSKFGGLSMVGYYEMANRMIQQFRALIVSANQVLVPSIADLQEKSPEKIRSVYLTNYNLLFYLALPLYTMIIISTPLISELWIGHYERIFVILGILLSAGNFLNTLAGPSYFANLGTGLLRWNVISHITIAILNAGLGAIFGIIFNGFGVVVAWIITLSLGSAVIYVAYHIENKIPLRELFPEDSRKMAGLCILIVLISFVIQPRIIYNTNAIILNIALIIAVLFLMLTMLYFHPMRKRMVEWILNDLVRKRIKA